MSSGAWSTMIQFLSIASAQMLLGEYHAGDKPHTGWSYAQVSPRVWGCCCAQRPVVHGMRLTARWMNAPIYDTRFEHLLGYGAVAGKCLVYLILCKPKQGDGIEAGSRKFPFMQPLPPVHVQLSRAYPVDFAKHVQFVQAGLFKITNSISTAMLVQVFQSREKQ